MDQLPIFRPGSMALSSLEPFAIWFQVFIWPFWIFSWNTDTPLRILTLLNPRTDMRITNGAIQGTISRTIITRPRNERIRSQSPWLVQRFLNTKQLCFDVILHNSLTICRRLAALWGAINVSQACSTRGTVILNLLLNQDSIWLFSIFGLLLTWYRTLLSNLCGSMSFTRPSLDHHLHCYTTFKNFTHATQSTITRSQTHIVSLI